MDIMSAIAGSGGVGVIARQLGIDEATAQSGLNALLPQVVDGVEKNGLPTEAIEPQLAAQAPAGDAGGLSGMLGGLLGGAGGGLLGGAGGGLLSSIVAGGLGNQVLGQIFGSKEVSREVAADASTKTGIDPALLKKMLPIIAGLVATYYLSHRGQAAPAGQGAQPEAAKSETGGGGLLGSILGGLTGR